MGRVGLFGAGVAGFLACTMVFYWACSFIVAIPIVAFLTTLLNFKVNISDRIGEQEQTDNIRDKHVNTSGTWPVSEYIQYKKLFALNDQLGNF